MSSKPISKEGLTADAAELESFISGDGESSCAQRRSRPWKERVNFPVLWLITLCLIFLNLLAIILFMHWRPRTYDIGFETDLSKLPSLLLLF